MWTQFWDMHSGGGLKEQHAFIYIEAPEDEARVIFYNRFGHRADRVSCTCCGQDYAVAEHEDLAQLTGYHRGCRSVTRPRNPITGRYEGKESEKNYLEPNEEPPNGYTASEPTHSTYLTLEQYLAGEDILVIRAADIHPDERRGQLPEQGYVWRD